MVHQNGSHTLLATSPRPEAMLILAFHQQDNNPPHKHASNNKILVQDDQGQQDQQMKSRAEQAHEGAGPNPYEKEK